ncbi:Uncharacterised protein [uncultured archaeon]|nr:Uncharacterised protein [uncultured archaeon]
MSEWKKASKVVEWREPTPNAHEFGYAGRTPQGGLSGGDDVYECKNCGLSTLEPSRELNCPQAHKGKTESVVVGKKDGWIDIREDAIVGKHIIVKDEAGIHIVDKEVFDKRYKVLHI